jgi:DNA-binding transcriptional regulator YiaG
LSGVRLSIKRRMAISLKERMCRVLLAPRLPECDLTHRCVRNGEQVTGPELKKLREDLAEAIGQKLTVADMAKLCGLPDADGANTIRKWEVTGPNGPVSELLRILAMASERYPILDNFNVFDRYNIDEKERPARRDAFREQMRAEVRRRLD